MRSVTHNGRPGVEVDIRAELRVAGSPPVVEAHLAVGGEHVGPPIATLSVAAAEADSAAFEAFKALVKLAMAGLIARSGGQVVEIREERVRDHAPPARTEFSS